MVDCAGASYIVSKWGRTEVSEEESGEMAQLEIVHYALKKVE